MPVCQNVNPVRPEGRTAIYSFHLKNAITMTRRLRLLLLISVAAFYAAMPPGLQAQDCISGVVYSDDNNNGVQDGPEGPLAGQTVVAVASDGTVSQATTLGDGSYAFCSLVTGPYFVYVELASPQLSANPASQFVVYAGAPIPGVDFGIVDLGQLGVIAGIAFFDLNGNGTQENFEPGLAGFPVTLDGSPLAAPIVMNTDDKGAFRFENLPQGDYTVSIVANIPNTSWFGPSSIGLGLMAGETVDNLRFVRLPDPGLASLVDFVCYDLDANGINDPATEPGIDGLSIELLDAQGMLAASTSSLSSGLYGFIAIEPGVYTVRAVFDAQDLTPTTPVSYTLDVPADGFQRPGPFYFRPERRLFKCGMEAMTFAGFTNSAGQVLSVKDTRDRSGAPVGVNADWVPPVSINHPDWTIGRMRNVYGLGIDKDYDLYVTATDIWGAISSTAGTPLIFRVDALTGAVSDFVVSNTGGTNALPNTGAAIGNICSNPDNDLLYATNRENGTIAVIAAFGNGLYTTGEVIQVFDPSFGGAATGQNLWGIAYNRSEGRVYFARDFADGINQNQIYSIGINTGTGMITGTETLEASVALYGSVDAHLTDIAFSQDGANMLTGERAQNYPHSTRVLQYNGGGHLSWNTIVPQLIHLGLASTNSAGGVDYGYTSFTGDSPPGDGCDTYIYASGNALVLEINNNVYGTAIIPATGNAPGSFANLNSIFIDSDNEILSQDKGYIGDVEVFDCACPAGCGQLGLAVSATPRDSLTTDSCCYTIDFSNTGPESVYGIELVALDGVEFSYTIAGGYYGPNFGNSNVTIVPGPPPSLTPMPNAVSGLADICLENVLATPQYILVNYLDSTFMTFCTDTLEFNCPVEQSCLYIVSDSLACDSLGYLYTVVVGNPSGGFPVGFVNFNISSPTSGVTFIPGTSFVLTDTIQPGEKDTLSFVIQTSADLFGDSLCFILSAHDGPEERLCCAEIDTCIAFPLCDPCPYVDATVKPVTDVQAEYCCFELFVTDTLTYNPNLFTAIQTTIITPGVNFAGLTTLPAQLDGWSYTPSSPTNSLLWTHSSGITPNGVNYNLFDFCVEGTTSTDSIYVEVKWLTADSMVMCFDTIAVYCPFCLTVVNDSLTCITNADGTQDYAYTFQVQNFSPFPVNTIGIVEIPSSSTNITPDVITIPTIPAFPPGGTSVPVTIMIDGSAGPVDSFCFDIVLRQVIQDSIDITCCYATHCIDLPACDLLPPFLCPDPALVSNDPCPLNFLPVCGCDDVTYTNACFASNAGITIWVPGVCDSLSFTDPVIELAGDPVSGGAVRLDWTLADDPALYSHFILRTWTEADGAENVLALVPVNAGQQQYTYVHQNGGYGIRKYDVLAAKYQGELAVSNIEQVFVMNDDQEQALVYTYPVPATQTVNVLSNRRGEAVLELVGPDGRMILQRREEFRGLPVPLDVSRVETGVYIIRLRFRDGQVGQQRVVKME